MNKIIAAVILFLAVQYAHSQFIVGRIVNVERVAVEGATIVAQTADSAFVDVGITNAEGQFRLKTSLQPYNLIIQHLAYKTKVLRDSCTNLGILVLEEKQTTLNGVEVIASLPLVKIEANGALSYNAKELIKNHVVGNALDILDQIPNIIKLDDSYSVVGGMGTTVILNGRKSLMSWEQLSELLASTSPDKIKKVEIFYVTPPEYGVKGSSINVVMETPRSEKCMLKGDCYMAFYQGKYFYPRSGIGLDFSHKKWSFYLNYSLSKGKKASQSILHSSHTINEELHEIQLTHTTKPNDFSQAITGLFSYQFKNKDALTLFYSGRFYRKKPNTSSCITMDDAPTWSESQQSKHGNLHTINAEYKHRALTAGVNYLTYIQKNRQDLKNSDATTSSNYLEEARQDVTSIEVYLNHFLKTQVGTFSYGMDGHWIETTNTQQTTWTGTKKENGGYVQIQREKEWVPFIGWRQNIGVKGTLNASLSLHYFISEVDNGREKRTLWNAYNLIPTLSFIYPLKPTATLQITLSSKKEYPTYAQITPRSYYINSYCMVEGNPALSPNQHYQLNVNCILKNKYILGVYGNTNSKYIGQFMYQDPDELMAVYKYINIDRTYSCGLLGTIPFKWARCIDSKITLDCFFAKQRGAIEQIPFNYKCKNWNAYLWNTVVLDKAKTMAFQADFLYKRASILAFHHIKGALMVNLGFNWKPKASGWSVSMKLSDPFKIYRNEFNALLPPLNYTQRRYLDYRQMLCTIRYSFGGYKPKKEKELNILRMDL